MLVHPSAVELSGVHLRAYWYSLTCAAVTPTPSRPPGSVSGSRPSTATYARPSTSWPSPPRPCAEAMKAMGEGVRHPRRHPAADRPDRRRRPALIRKTQTAWHERPGLDRPVRAAAPGLAGSARLDSRPDRRTSARERRSPRRREPQMLGGQGVPRSRRTCPGPVPGPPPQEMEAPPQQHPRRDPLPRRAGLGRPSGCTHRSMPTAGGLTSIRGRWRVGCGAAAVFGIDALGLFELVFEDDDAAGGFDGCALVDEFAGAGGDA